MRTTVLYTLLFLLCSCAIAQPNNGETYNLVVGTYTNKEKTNGIHVYSFNTKTGQSSFRSKTLGIRNPSYLAVSKDRKNLYSVSEVENGTIQSFAFNAHTGELNFLNSVSSGGDGPCYVSVDDNKELVFAANYDSGSIAAIRVEKDGSLDTDIQKIQHEESSDSNAKPHAHAVVLSPDGHYLLAADLGIDQVKIYEINPASPQALYPAKVSSVSVSKGGGPRHLTFHPNGKYAYLILEMGASIVGFDYKDGILETKQTITMLSPEFKGTVEAADIHVSPDGKFLYGSNRAEANEIVIYSIAKNGILKYAGRQTTNINTPRNFVIDPSGNFLLVANSASNEIIIFKRDKKSGLLSPGGQKIMVDKPVCLKFVAID
ncbi:MAG: lactonase family protein [Daejeonella sp.]|uniref:lactonase family protein n=1 Tax=Daejeonella sp. TaxID=2805397 RepID=UPI0027324AF1|nr:lactonase family protein [Daejeonella sp.]MDP3469672.1 lactonase family protein [Daejeonella sp.]